MLLHFTDVIISFTTQNNIFVALRFKMKIHKADTFQQIIIIVTQTNATAVELTINCSPTQNVL
jgi:hypothetical protein